MTHTPMAKPWFKPIWLYATLVLVAPAIAQDHARIAGFQAHLFNSKTGTLSGDMLADGAPELGNVPSGDLASVSTLIVVRVALGSAAPIPEHAQVRFVASASGAKPARKGRGTSQRIILDRTSRLGPVGPNGTTYVGFWLPETGCQTISLTASLPGVKGASTVTGSLPFSCYE